MMFICMSFLELLSEFYWGLLLGKQRQTAVEPIEISVEKCYQLSTLLLNLEHNICEENSLCVHTAAFVCKNKLHENYLTSITEKFWSQLHLHEDTRLHRIQCKLSSAAIWRYTINFFWQRSPQNTISNTSPTAI